jgi:pimeloyl-ACP methyl ester carboxylesterase
VRTTQQLRDGKFTVEIETLGTGEPLIFFHSATGLKDSEPFLEELARDFKVIAPHLPGYGESTGGEQIDDVIDAALFYHELMDSLGVPSAYLMGHSMGGMLAAEVAALDVHRARKLVLVNSTGLWLDKHPTVDIFATDLSDFPALLFHDPNSSIAKQLATIPTETVALNNWYVEHMRRFAMATKFMWPIPDRGLKKRAYRIAAPTLVLWGESDRIISPAYAKEFVKLIPNAREQIIKQAGHMVMYERQAEFCTAVRDFLKQ